MEYDLVVKNGRVVSSLGTYEGGFAVKEGKFTMLAKDPVLESAARSAITIDAKGKIILPGAIDPHTHYGIEIYGQKSPDDFFWGTRAAAFGGITSVIDYSTQSPETTLPESFRQRLREAEGNSNIDYSIHAAATRADEDTLNSVSHLVKQGCPSFKVFMIYKKRGYMMDDLSLMKMMKAVHDAGGVLEIHAENGPLLEGIAEEMEKQKLTHTKYHREKHPDFIEAEAVARAGLWAAQTKCPTYIVHMSSGLALQEAERLKRNNVPLFVETCPQYLMLDDRVYDDEQLGKRYIVCPPVRKAIDRETLWEGIVKGLIDVIGTDHVAFTLAQKNSSDSFLTVPPGLPGSETMLPIMFSEGVMKGRISLHRLVELTSTNASRIFGLSERKGAVKPGNDADFVIMDAKKVVKVTPEVLHSKIDWSPYDGLGVQGWPESTFLRGTMLVKEGVWCGPERKGIFIERYISERKTSSLYNKKLEIA